MKKNKKFPVKIVAFRAIDNYKACLSYIKGHRKVLAVHGFSHFLSNEESWMFNPDTICTMVWDSEMKTALGGARFEKRTKESLLSFERVLMKTEPEVVPHVKKKVRSGTGEVCGLWNSKEVAGWNTSILLVRSVLITLFQMGYNSTFAFNARYTNRIPMRLGFERLKIIGINGYVPYPDDRFLAAIWRFDIKKGLDRANAYEKEKMKSLIENPVQHIIEEDIYNNLDVSYDLSV